MKEHYINLAKGLKNKGMEVTALCYFEKREMEDLRNYNIDVIPFHLRGGINLIQDLDAVMRVVKIIKEQKVDVIHCHGFKAGLVGRLAAWMTGCPCVYTVHNFLPNSTKIKKIIAVWLEKILALKTHSIITVSKALRSYEMEMLNVSGDRIKVVYNGIQMSRLQESHLDVRKKWGIKERDILVGTVARLIPSKGIDLLIQAIPEILKKYPDVKFMIVGGGPDEGRLKELAKSHHCEKNIIFTGHVKYIWYYYNAFDIFILPTLSEGLGISVLEAMASGKPVIASNTGGIPEIIEHGVNGYLIPPGSSQKIMKAILYLISQPEERARYIKAGYKTIRHNFDYETMVDRTLDILIESINSNKSIKK
jgi:glycosyltransferase involved in cell wall biosynthesis